MAALCLTIVAIGTVAILDDAVVVTVTAAPTGNGTRGGVIEGPRIWLIGLDDNGRLTITVQTRQPYFGSRDYLGDFLPWQR